MDSYYRVNRPLSTETQSEASCSYSLRPRKENPLKRKTVDLQEESQLNERPNKRRRTNSPQKGPLSTETQSEASCPYFLRPRKENPLKVSHFNKRQTKRRANSPQKGALSAENQAQESCKEKTTDLPQDEMPKEQRKQKSKKKNIQKGKDPRWLEMKEFLSTYSEPSGSYSGEDCLADVPDPHSENLPDDFTERYTLGELLGKGSNAKVYTGIRKSDGEQVAIKYLLKCFVNYSTLPDGTRSLPHEAVMMELASSPRSSRYVIKLFEWFETPKGFLLVMERPKDFINLKTFRRGLKGRLTEDVARIIMRKILKACIHCQDNGVLHLDAKEHNILIHPETLDVKLIDFGRSRLMHMRTYKVFGGPLLFHPVCWLSTFPFWEAMSVVYHLGRLLYILTCGDQAQDSPIPLSIDGLSQDCCDLIRKCLKTDPEERPCCELILWGKWCQVKDPSSGKRRRRRRRRRR